MNRKPQTDEDWSTIYFLPDPGVRFILAGSQWDDNVKTKPQLSNSSCHTGLKPTQLFYKMGNRSQLPNGISMPKTQIIIKIR